MSSSSKNPDNINWASVIALDAVSVVIAIFCLGLRLYVRKFIVKKVSLDDWLLILGVFAFVVTDAIDIWCWNVEAIEGVDAGGNKHFQLLNIEGFPYFIAEVTTRAAYTVFYLRLLPSQIDDYKRERYILLIAFWTYATYQIVSAFMNLFQCGNPANIGNPDAVCIDGTILSNMYAASYGFDVILDWLMALLPISIILKSTMTRRTKMSAVSILLLGCVASILAIVVIPLNYTGTSGYSDVGSQLFPLIVDLLSNTETLVVIICLSLVACKPLFSRFLDQTNGVSVAESQTVFLVGSKASKVPDFSIEISELDEARLSVV
ncbi:hypothetical protein K461DRAFT_296673 [Myriangium duriaei CBS 260.36]|uniref:GP-PDE domain-containing protein n=1 Tax=Myriangium duriaei CBS 260.36 TaxID=1168546 RepID=A0A9P4MDS7_9PEZI|nr:hypothetical protein K461DRAFT_296673 [Myriangium duriaei CBS 260.36]